MSEIYREQVDPDAANNPHSFAIRMVGSGQRVLEVGCSVGHVSEHLVAAGNTVVGVEIDPDAAEASRRWTTATHVLDLDVARVSDVESGPFDVIVLGDVLEHLRDPAVTLRDLVTLLDGDGRLVISLPHVGFIDVRLMLLEGRWQYQDLGLLDHTHLRWFTRESIRELLDDVGFRACRVDRVRMGRGASLLPVSPHLHDDEIVEFVESDPESSTYQFVVEARAASAVAHDALDEPAVEWPDLRRRRAERVAELEATRRRVDELEQHVTALQANLDAWEGSLVARSSRPLRALWAAIRR